MRILILNAHQYTQSGTEKFEFFQNTIISIIKEQKELTDTENEFFIRDKENIDDFLYEEESSFIRIVLYQQIIILQDCAHRFDSLDLIFIQGDANLRPWSASCDKILCLLRMCFRAQKYVFASSFAMQGFVFLSATNIEKQIFVINGLEGGKLAEIKEIKFKKEIKHCDYFLDNTSGDLYQFNYESGQWLCKANIGLTTIKIKLIGMHQRKSAQEFQQIGKYILKAPIYKHKNKGSITVNLRSEAICNIKKNFLQHYFCDANVKFLGCLLVLIQQFAQSIEQSYRVLAESDNGVLILEFPSIIATQFEISSRYPLTMQILENYMLHILSLIKNHKYLIMSQFKSHEQIDSDNLFIKLWLYSIKRCIEEFLNNQQQKRNTLLLMESRIKSNGIPISGDFEGQLEQHNSKMKSDRYKYNFNIQYSSSERKLKRSQLLSANLNIQKLNQEDLQAKFFQTEGDEDLEEARPKLKTKLTSGEVRQFLHPTLSNDTISTGKLWVPGFFSQNIQQNCSPKLQEGISKVLVSQSRTTTSQSSRRKFKNQESVYFQISHYKFFSNCPYVTYHDVELKHQQENDKKIIGHKRLKFSIVKEPEKIFLLSDHQTLQRPTTVHEFRKIDKQKWISKFDFKI